MPLTKNGRRNSMLWRKNKIASQNKTGANRPAPRQQTKEAKDPATTATQPEPQTQAATTRAVEEAAGGNEAPDEGETPDEGGTPTTTTTATTSTARTVEAEEAEEATTEVAEEAEEDVLTGGDTKRRETTMPSTRAIPTPDA